MWYSQVLTQTLGMDRFQAYVDRFHYGNQDLRGDPGQNNGLTRSWLSTSLDISPAEQAAFLEQLISSALPVSRHAQQMTKKILYVEDLPGGWKLYGKTGAGFLLNKNKTKKLDISHGWFVGWIEKGARKMVFAHHIIDDKNAVMSAGTRAKKQAKAELLRILVRSKNSKI